MFFLVLIGAYTLAPLNEAEAPKKIFQIPKIKIRENLTKKIIKASSVASATKWNKFDDLTALLVR